MHIQSKIGKKTYEILEQFSLSHLANTNFHKLSGGQKQLGLILRALLQEAQILVLDEPLSALDISHSFSVLNILQTLNKTIILTSHNPELCFMANKFLMLKKGEILQFGTKDILCTQNINDLYDISTKEITLPNGGKYFYYANQAKL